MKLYVSFSLLIFLFIQSFSAETIATAINFDGVFIVPILNGEENTAVKYNGINYDVTVISKNEQSNIAVIRANCATTPLKTGNSNTVLTGSTCRAVIFKPAETNTPPVVAAGKITGWKENSAGYLMMQISFPNDLPPGTPVVNQYGEIIAIATGNNLAVAINDIKALLKSSRIALLPQSKSVTYSDVVLPARLSPGIAFLTAGQQSAKNRVNTKDNAMLITIPAGIFLMGSIPTDTLPFDETPQKKVTLDEYEIYRDEVTVKQYQQFCKETNRKMPIAPVWGWQDNKPMVNVTWQDAMDYAAWAGAKLPTEAQWEKASRGIDGRIYPWNNNFAANKCVSLNTEGINNSFPADEYDPIEDESIYGVRHTAGNVAEWCFDWYGADYYVTSPGKNPTGPETGSKKVLRGGSYRYNLPSRFRCAARFSSIPAFTSQDIGFRCVVNK